MKINNLNLNLNLLIYHLLTFALLRTVIGCVRLSVFDQFPPPPYPLLGRSEAS